MKITIVDHDAHYTCKTYIYMTQNLNHEETQFGTDSLLNCEFYIIEKRCFKLNSSVV